jgi:hypothetical protein
MFDAQDEQPWSGRVLPKLTVRDFPRAGNDEQFQRPPLVNAIDELIDGLQAPSRNENTAEASQTGSSSFGARLPATCVWCRAVRINAGVTLTSRRSF